MDIANGVLSPKRSLKGSLSDLQITWWEAMLLLSSGALAVYLHQILRMPLGLPGRHGLEWMAILILGRALSRWRYAGSLSSVGASLFSILPIWGAADDPFIWVIYLIPGMVIDLAYTRLPGLQNKLWFLMLLGGLAHATKPLFRFGVSLVTGFPYGSLINGVLYPLSTHFLFGLLGGLTGALVVLGVKNLGKNREQK